MQCPCRRRWSYGKIDAATGQKGLAEAAKLARMAAPAFVADLEASGWSIHPMKLSMKEKNGYVLFKQIKRVVQDRRWLTILDVHHNLQVQGILPVKRAIGRKWNRKYQSGQLILPNSIYMHLII